MCRFTDPGFSPPKVMMTVSVDHRGKAGQPTRSLNGREFPLRCLNKKGDVKDKHLLLTKEKYEY